jgi:cadmium resistance protein CadD (predicted permease)
MDGPTDLRVAVPLCEYAQRVHKNKLMVLNIWVGLLLMFGLAVVAFSCAAILLYVKSEWISGAASTVGAIASGGGMKWVVNRKNDAKKDEREAYREVRDSCGSEPADRARAERKPLLVKLLPG